MVAAVSLAPVPSREQRIVVNGVSWKEHVLLPNLDFRLVARYARREDQDVASGELTDAIATHKKHKPRRRGRSR